MGVREMMERWRERVRVRELMRQRGGKKARSLAMSNLSRPKCQRYGDGACEVHYLGKGVWN